MTDNPSSAPQATTAQTGVPLCSADILLNLVVIFLTPIFLSAADGDIILARLAAIETIKSYRAQSQADLLTVAQIVAFGFATLGSLCLSMADDISLTMVLRLRGNANALSRSAETHRRRLEQSRANASQPQPVAPAPTQAPQPAMAPPPAPPAHPAVEDATPLALDPSAAEWAAACAEAAEQITASLPDLPPQERQMAAIQAAAFNYCATDMLAEINAQRPEPGQRDAQASPHPATQDKHLLGSA